MSRSSHANCRSAATSSPSCTRFRARLGTYPPDTTVLHSADWRRSQVRRYRNLVDDWASFPSDRLRRVVAGYRPGRRAHAQSGRDRDRASGRSAGEWTFPSSTPSTTTSCSVPRKSLMQPNGEPCRPHPLLCGLRTRRMVRWAPRCPTSSASRSSSSGVHREMFARARQHLIMHPVVPPALDRFAGPETDCGRSDTSVRFT